MSNPYIPFNARKSLHVAKPKPVAQPKKKPAPITKSKAVMDNFNRAAFIAERGTICECGECRERAEDVHHALIGRMKNHPELDAWENLVYVSHFEHVSLHKFNTLEWRKKFYRIQVERYGRERMMKWIASLPTKLKHRIDFLP